MKTTSLFSAVLLMVAAMADDQEADKPMDLTETEFYDIVVEGEDNTVKGEKPWFIELYSPQCPHCVDFNPTWDAYH